MAKPAMYERTTRESDWDRINPISDDVLACIETTSTQYKKGLLGIRSNPVDRDMESVVAALVTPGWFIWGHYGDKTGTAVMTARTDSLEVLPYQHAAIFEDHGIHITEHLWRKGNRSHHAEVFEDHGIHITGLWTGAVQRSQMFMGMGTESDAEEFKQVLKDAVEKAHNSA